MTPSGASEGAEEIEHQIARWRCNASGATSANFEITRGLLQSDPLFLLYLDLGAILDELIEEGEVDLDDWNAAALRGFGLSWDIEDRVGRFRFVVPISDPEGGE